MLVLLIQDFLNEIEKEKVILIWKIRKMQFRALPPSFTMIRFYFKTISIFLKNKLLILHCF